MLNLLLRRPWTPATSRHVTGWWNPRAMSSMLFSGTAVSSYRDVIGGAAFTQAFSSQRPLWNGSAFGAGWPGLDYDGSDDCLERMQTPPFGSGSSEGGFLAVVKQAALPADTNVRSAVAAGNTTANKREIARVVDAGANRARGASYNGTTTSAVQDTAVDFSTRHIVLVTFTASLLSLEIDGVVTTTAVAGLNTSTSRSRFGANASSTAGGFWFGSLADIVSFVGIPPADDFKRMRDFLRPMVI